MERWVAAGLDPARFWGETPRTVQVIMRGIAERRLRDYELLGWHAKVAGLYAQVDPKKAPPVDKLVKRAPRRMSGQQIDMAMRAWARSANAKFSSGPQGE